jgi:hypothetical protein
MERITRRSVLKTAAAVALAGSGITAAQAIESEHPDRALILLGEKMESASTAYDLVQAQYHGDASHEADAICERAYHVVSSIMNEIETKTPRTIDGLRVKARACQWCFSGDPIEFGRNETTDVRLAAQIINALLEA